MFENVDGRTDDGRTDGQTTDAGVTGILIAHLRAFGSGELKIIWHCHSRLIWYSTGFFCSGVNPVRSADQSHSQHPP